MHSPVGNELLPVASLEEYFRDSVDAALASNRVVVDRSTAYYVVRLLTLYARTDAGYDAGHDAGHSAGQSAGKRQSGQRPLALMLAESLEVESPEERLALLQRMGDVALFTAGFFAEALQDRAVGLDYYINMGGGAYRTLARNGARTARVRALAEVFAELAAKFLELVDVLHEVRAAARSSSNHDLLRLYEQWLRTGSPRAGRLLLQAGVQPTRQGLTHSH